MRHCSYSAPWGLQTWLITGILSALMLAVAIGSSFVLGKEGRGQRGPIWIIPTLVVVGILGGASLWRVRRYELADDELLVARSFWSNRIRLLDIESAEVDPKACERAWKTYGNDGLFAMHGRFRNQRLGKFQAYVTDRKNAVVIRVPGDIIVISPENPGRFVADLRRRLQRGKERG